MIVSGLCAILHYRRQAYGHPTYAASVDFRAADSVSHPALWLLLKRVGVPDYRKSSHLSGLCMLSLLVIFVLMGSGACGLRLSPVCVGVV